MDTWVIAIISMSIYLVFAFGLGLAAGRGKSFFSVSELRSITSQSFIFSTISCLFK